MSDIFDRASTRESEILSDNLDEQQRRAGLAGKTMADSARICTRCQEPISEARRAAYPGTQLCIECKTLEEKRRRRAN